MKASRIYLLVTFMFLHTFSVLNAQDHPKEAPLLLQEGQDMLLHFNKDSQYRLGKEVNSSFLNKKVLSTIQQPIKLVQGKGLKDSLLQGNFYKILEAGKIQEQVFIDTLKYGNTVPMPNARPMIVMNNGTYQSNMPWKKIDGSDCAPMPNALPLDTRSTSMSDFNIIGKEGLNTDILKKDRPDQ